MCEGNSLIHEVKGAVSAPKGLRPWGAPRGNTETVRQQGFHVSDPKQRPPHVEEESEFHLSISDVSKMQVSCGQMRTNGSSRADWALPHKSSPVGMDPGRAEHKLLPQSAKTSLQAYVCYQLTERVLRRCK